MTHTRKSRRKRIIVAVLHPTDCMALPTNADHVQPTRSASDSQMFSKLQLKQLTEAFAAGKNTAPIPLGTFYETPTDPGYEVCDVVSIFTRVILLAILVLKYSAIALSRVTICPTTSR